MTVFVIKIVVVFVAPSVSIGKVRVNIYKVADGIVRVVDYYRVVISTVPFDPCFGNGEILGGQGETSVIISDAVCGGYSRTLVGRHGSHAYLHLAGSDIVNITEYIIVCCDRKTGCIARISVFAYYEIVIIDYIAFVVTVVVRIKSLTHKRRAVHIGKIVADQCPVICFAAVLKYMEVIIIVPCRGSGGFIVGNAGAPFYGADRIGPCASLAVLSYRADS